MIRGTKNESISSLSKQRHDSNSLLDYTGTKGQSYEAVAEAVGSAIAERRDEFDIHSSLESVFPSNAFNGSFE